MLLLLPLPLRNSSASQSAARWDVLISTRANYGPREAASNLSSRTQQVAHRGLACLARARTKPTSLSHPLRPPVRLTLSVSPTADRRPPNQPPPPPPVPPQPPTIGPVSQAPAREGQEYQLSCLSAGGNPEPNITWFRNDQQLVSGGAGPVPVRIEQVRQSGSTNSTLTWIPTIDDHQAIYRCSVSNKAMSGLAPFERELTLAVECK